MIERKVIHFLIIENEEWDKSWCKRWNDESSFTQHDALTAENDVKLSL